MGLNLVVEQPQGFVGTAGFKESIGIEVGRRGEAQDRRQQQYKPDMSQRSTTLTSIPERSGWVPIAPSATVAPSVSPLTTSTRVRLLMPVWISCARSLSSTIW